MRQIKIFSGEGPFVEGKVNKFLENLNKKGQKADMKLACSAGHITLLLEYDEFHETSEPEMVSPDTSNKRNFRIGT